MSFLICLAVVSRGLNPGAAVVYSWCSLCIMRGARFGWTRVKSDARVPHFGLDDKLGGMGV